MGQPKGPFYQSCGMPMEKPEDFGMNADGFRSNDYCYFCLKDGCFTEPHITMQQMIDKVAGMAGKMNMSEAQAREMAKGLFLSLRDADNKAADKNIYSQITQISQIQKFRMRRHSGRP